MRSKPESVMGWKSKIDPDLDKAVKIFLRFLRMIKDETDEGNFAVKDEVLPLFENQEPRNYEEMENLMAQGQDELKAAIDELFSLSPIQRKRQGEDAKKELISSTESFSAASREYYRDKFDHMSNGTFFKPTVGLPNEKRIKNIRYNTVELASSLFALIIRVELNDLESSIEDSYNELADDSSEINFAMECIYSVFAQIAFQSTIEALLKKGDDKSLINALRIDKGILMNEKFRKRMAKAQISGNQKFLNKVARAISTKPLHKESPYYESYMVLRYFWLAGPCKLKPKELYDFLIDCEVRPGPPDYPDNLDKFLTRNIRPLFKNQVLFPHLF